MKVDQESVQEFEVLTRIHAVLLSDKPIRTMKFSDGEHRTIRPFNFLTQKPMLYVANIHEDDIADYDDNPYVKQIDEFAQKDNADMVVISAKIEAELSELDDEEKMMFLEDLGVVESGLDQLIKHSYSLLGLETFFTAGPKEVRAWTYKRGSLAPACAGVIHSDFEKGFIRAETIHYQDFVDCGGEHGAKEQGKMRLEGRNYVVQDGDVMHFLFNV
jgi:hypothetical protein